MEAIERVGLEVARDQCGNSCEKMAAYLNKPVQIWKNDSFVAAFPSPVIHITYGIHFPQVCILLGCKPKLLNSFKFLSAASLPTFLHLGGFYIYGMLRFAC